MKIIFSALLMLSPLLNPVLSAQKPKAISGQIEQIPFESKFVATRNVTIWLPEGYTPKKKYAVLYMHDGQMLFDSTITWNKQEWGVDECLSTLMQAHEVKNCIVVGIWNNGEYRHAEYFPQRVAENLKGEVKDLIYTKQLKGAPLADNYLKFLVTELKPWVDKQYSTKKDMRNTVIMGSSMGGLISLYALCEYPEVFGAAACLSMHSPLMFKESLAEKSDNPAAAEFRAYLRTHLPQHPKRRIYIDYGDQTLDQFYAPYQKAIDGVISAQGYTNKYWETRFFPGENHSEVAWSKRLAIPMRFLLKK